MVPLNKVFLLYCYNRNMVSLETYKSLIKGSFCLRFFIFIFQSHHCCIFKKNLIFGKMCRRYYLLPSESSSAKTKIICCQKTFFKLKIHFWKNKKKNIYFFYSNKKNWSDWLSIQTLFTGISWIFSEILDIGYNLGLCYVRNYFSL